MTSRALLPWFLPLIAACGYTDPSFDHQVSTAFTVTWTGTATSSSVPSTTCTRTYTDNGALEINYSERDGGIVGSFRVRNDTRANTTASSGCALEISTILNFVGDVTGTASAVSLERSESVFGGTQAEKVALTGTLSGGVITGTLTFTTSGKDPGGNTRAGSGSVSVTLR